MDWPAQFGRTRIYKASHPSFSWFLSAEWCFQGFHIQFFEEMHSYKIFHSKRYCCFKVCFFYNFLFFFLKFDRLVFFFCLAFAKTSFGNLILERYVFDENGQMEVLNIMKSCLNSSLEIKIIFFSTVYECVRNQIFHPIPCRAVFDLTLNRLLNFLDSKKEQTGETKFTLNLLYWIEDLGETKPKEPFPEMLQIIFSYFEKFDQGFFCFVLFCFFCVNFFFFLIYSSSFFYRIRSDNSFSFCLF
jgi:hypothetical protein